MLKKRSLPLLLILLLVFSSFAQAAPLSRPADIQNDQLTEVLNGFKDGVVSTDGDNNYNATDKVRVVVEVAGDTAIKYATDKGVKYSTLSDSVKESLQNKALSQQATVKSTLAKKAIKMEYKQSFTTVYNGFSGVVEYGDIAAIENTPGVVSVKISNEYQLPEEQPDMNYSKEIVQAQQAWRDYGYKGEGMVVGVIDTGIDYTHKDMVLTDPSKEALTQTKVNALIAAKGLKGKFYTDKVPYGYNYMDENAEIRHLGPGVSMHGMHVSGTVAANGDESKGGIKGVAPEAQLLALKVFGNNPSYASTYGDIYVKAMDDAIILGADVLNMSLGSVASFVRPDDAEQVAIKNAVANGVLFSISAGNSGSINYGYTTTQTFASNPDIGVVGSPGLNYDSLQVASLENNFMDLFAATFNYEGVTDAKAAYMAAGTIDPVSAKGKYDVLDAGLGRWPGTTNQVDQNANDFTGKDFTGKVALIKRGEIGFVDKALNAQKAGAIGVIIYNNTDGWVNMATDPKITVPYLFVQKVDGDKLAAALAAGKAMKVEFKGDKVKAPNANAGKMSDFTSWGVTPNLDFKPEITAPGGQIYSTLNDNQYGMMSGTSMAAPHVAGGSALVLERVKKDFANLSGKDKVYMAKNLLMNTSKPLLDKGTYNTAYGIGGLYSPRREGAGVMQLASALATPIVVTEKNTNEAKVALKEITGNKAVFTLVAKNYSNKTVTYDVSGNVQTDLALKSGSSYLNVQEAQPVYDLVTEEEPISFNKQSITIDPNSSVSVDVTVDLTNASDWAYGKSLNEIFPNGYFVEGFVTLKDPSDVNPTVSVPYVGFKGDWNKPPIFDEMLYDGKSGNSYYKMAAMYSSSTTPGSYNRIGANPIDGSLKTSYIAISPNGDKVNDDAVPVVSFMRNAKLVVYKILDKDGNVLRKINTVYDARKNYYDAGRGKTYSLSSANVWDGKIKNQVAADGLYYYAIEGTIDYDGKAPQVQKYPVIVDTKAPTVKASIDGKVVTITGSDSGSGIAYYDILVDGKSVFTKPTLAGTATSYTLATAPAAGSTVQVVAYDYAGNAGSAFTDTTIPYVYVTSLNNGGVYSTHTLPVAGYVTDGTTLKTLTVNGKSVAFTYNAALNRYDFSTTVTVDKDGITKVVVSGTDAANNSISYEVRDLMIDTTAPTINVYAPAQVGADVTSVDLTATVADNFDELSYYVDGSQEYYHEFNYPFEMRAHSKEVTTTVTLAPGNNKFVLEATDLAGLKTTKVVNIYRGDAITGTLARNGEALGNLQFAFHTLDGKQWYDVVTDARGNFVVQVPDGTYQIDGIWDGSLWKWYVLNQQFTVKDGKLVGADSLAVRISASERAVTGKLTKDGQALGNTQFAIHTTTGEVKWFDAVTDANGNFSFALPDGTYKLEGIWVDGEKTWYEQPTEFTVNGSTVFNIDVKAPVMNVTGKLAKGTQSLGGVQFAFHNAAGTQWYDVFTSADGSFATKLPDGKYQLDGVWLGNENKWYVLNLQFSIENGQLVGKDRLDINLPN